MQAVWVHKIDCCYLEQTIMNMLLFIMLAFKKVSKSSFVERPWFSGYHDGKTTEPDDISKTIIRNIKA